MRKTFLFITALLLSCTLVWAERVAEEDALSVANQFMVVTTSSAGSNKAPAKRMVLHKSALTEASQYYICENADGEGWVLVAANDVVRPILAYSETGHFSTEKMPNNIKSWLGKYNNYITRLEKEGVAASEETKNEWKAMRQGQRRAKQATVIVGPLITTQWDQDAPYYNLCPGSGSNKAYTGCVATAMAQVMNYWEWPVKGTGSHSYRPLDPNDGESYSSRYTSTLTANFGNTTYDWANMLDSYSGSYTEAQGTAVATLMYHCGVATEMMYGNDADGGSGTYTVNYGSWTENDNAQNAFVNFFGYPQEGLVGYMRDGYTYKGTTYYESWTDAAWTAMVKEELDKQHPIMYGGTGDEGGHSFICDGYNSDNYFHFNWGWSGENDGYYLLSNLTPGSGGAGGGSYSFSEDQDVIIGIRRPLDDANVEWYANGELFSTTVATGGVLTLPASTPEGCDNDKVFMGWTAQEDYENETTAPTFAKAGDLLEEDGTYYAVYATAEEGEGTSTTTTIVMENLAAADGNSNGFTLTGDKATGSSAPAYNETNKDARYYAGNTLTISSENAITEIVFNLSTQGLKRLAPITASTGTIAAQASGDTKVTWTGSATEVTFTVGANADYGSDGSSKAGQLDFTTINITAGAGVTYSDYSTNCGTPAEKFAITVNSSEHGTLAASKTEQAAGRSVTITATPDEYYELNTLTVKDASNNDVTVSGEGNVRTFVMPESAVTVSGTFAELPTYTVRFLSEGEIISEQEVHEGYAATKPANPTTTCSDYSFVGWWTAELAADNTTAQTWVSNFTTTKAQDYYAIFKRVESTGEETLTDNYKKITTTDELENANYIVVGSYNSNYYAMKNEVKSSYYVAQQQVTPSSDVITTTDGSIIWQITVNGNSLSFYNAASSQYIHTYQSGTHTNLGFTDQTTDNINYTYTVSGGVWDFVSTAITTQHLEYYGSYSEFTTYTKAGDPIYLYKQQIEGTSTTYYTSSVSCETTAIEKPSVEQQARKILRDGQIFILKGDKIYTITGQETIIP